MMSMIERVDRERTNNERLILQALYDLVIKQMMHFYEEQIPQLLSTAGATTPYSHDYYRFSFVAGNYEQDAHNMANAASGQIKPLPITPLRKEMIKTKYAPQYWGVDLNPNAQEIIPIVQGGAAVGGTSSSSAINAKN